MRLVVVPAALALLLAGGCATGDAATDVAHDAPPGPRDRTDLARRSDTPDAPRTDLETAADDTGGWLPDNATVIPYVIQSDLFETGFGAAFALHDWPHEKATTAGFGIASSNGSLAVAFVGANWRTGIHERVLLDPLVSVGTYGDQRIYTGRDPRFPGERAGEHDSASRNYKQGDGDDIHVRPKFQIVLPIGNGRDEIRHEPVMENGLLVGNPAGGDTWNPLESGRTSIYFEPFYRNQSADAGRRDINLRSNGVKVGLEYDNTDFRSNPSTGSRQRVAVARDFGWFDSTDAWTSMEGQLSKYFDLGSTDVLAQQVLAFDVWGAHAFTWRTKETSRGPALVRAPPNFEGARLGGLYRLRAYDSSRFSDQSALHYTAEYRIIPRRNPLDSIPLLREIGADWTQFVIFGEMGRVNEGFDLSDLHTDMKRDVGIGVRLFVQGVVIRVDAAWSGEGAGLQVMVSQPF